MAAQIVSRTTRQCGRRIRHFTVGEFYMLTLCPAECSRRTINRWPLLIHREPSPPSRDLPSCINGHPFHTKPSTNDIRPPERVTISKDLQDSTASKIPRLIVGICAASGGRSTYTRRSIWTTVRARATGHGIGATIDNRNAGTYKCR